MSHPSSNDSTSLGSVTVIVPALNEERSIARVLGDLPSVGRVVVVDNGSTDETADIAADCGAEVVSEPKRGYGAACLRGLRAIEDLIADGQDEPSVVAFIDADYSDDPTQLPVLVEPILKGQADFVLGSRILGEREQGAMPPQSVYGNKLACFLMRLLFHHRFTDLGPFRAIDYPKLRRLKMCDTNFGWTIEMQIKGVCWGLEIQEVAVPYRRRVGRSKISGTVSGTIKAGAKILYTVAKYGLRGRKLRAEAGTGGKGTAPA